MRITHERSCEVRLPNDVLVVFSEPTGQELRLGDVISFQNFALDANVGAENRTRGGAFTVRINANNVHDLRLPSHHGGSRTPTPARLIAD